MLEIVGTLIFCGFFWYFLNKEICQHIKELELKNKELRDKIIQLKKEHKDQFRRLLGDDYSDSTNFHI